MDTLRSAGADRMPAAMAALLQLVRRRDVSPAVSGPPHWDAPGITSALAEVANHHGVLGLMILELGRVRPEFVQEFAATLQFLRRQAGLWDLERNAIADLLAANGIRAVMLKGAALRLTAYDNPVARAFGDIDILVEKDNLAAATRILTAYNYRSQSAERMQLYLDHHHHLIFEKPPGFKVELHWALTPVRYPLRLDAAAILRDARPVQTRVGATALVPSPVHMVLHVSAQNLEESFARLRRLIDIDRTIAASRDFRWDSLAAEARRLHLQRVVALSLRLCELLLGTPVPEGFIDSLGVTRVGRAHMALFDPVGLVTRRMRPPRSAYARLLMLWCIQDHAMQRQFVRGMVTGDDEWFGRQVSGRSHPASTLRELVAMGKLGSYQLLLYPTAVLNWLRSPRGSSLWAR